MILFKYIKFLGQIILCLIIALKTTIQLTELGNKMGEEKWPAKGDSTWLQQKSGLIMLLKVAEASRKRAILGEKNYIGNKKSRRKCKRP